MKKLFNIALVISVAYIFILVASTAEGKPKKRKNYSRSNLILRGSPTGVCTPKISNITQSWSGTSGSDVISIDWSCSGVSYNNCNIYVVAHVYKNGQPYPPDDPINFKINNIWIDGDSLGCGSGKVTSLFVFLGNIPSGNYSCEVDVYNGTADYHSTNSIATNTYNWVIQ